MQTFEQLLKQFEESFSNKHFPETPSTLYDPAQYILNLGGKRIRPVCVLLGNELFDTINPDSFHAATAVELFHNFSLIHDDIMDKAPLRRGMQTVHAKYGEPTALLAGDVMFVQAYIYLSKMKPEALQKVLPLFNKTASEVCEGQQLDMDFEAKEQVSFDEYLHMITLKTSVLLAGSLQLGAILGGATLGNQQYLYEFGKNLGIAFQIQDDYLDAFGDPAKFGKKIGGDILANKKTFLLIHALETANAVQKQQLTELLKTNPADKVERVLSVFKEVAVDEWAMQLKNNYLEKAMKHLDDIAVLSKRKEPLNELAQFLMKREY
ncbi:MAG: polyprenyl synthetase family protein [Chitinophagaceae bacterium]|jgi:geranylgeranyl diphosphate synthase, type II|nr:polyprenyl synthetase family protein [Chitinophagaceae bacterium]